MTDDRQSPEWLCKAPLMLVFFNEHIALIKSKVGLAILPPFILEHIVQSFVIFGRSDFCHGVGRV